MRKLLVVAGLALLFPVAASAGSNLGVKLGLAFPGGEAYQGAAMSDTIAMAIPVEVSANFGLSPQLDVGVYLGYAFVQPDADFVDYCNFYGGSCEEHLWRFGVKSEFALGSSGQGFSPFVGANFGFEWDVLNQDLPDLGDDYTYTLRGWELGFELGADAWMSQTSKLGAFVGLSFGEYNWEHANGTIGGVSGDASGSFSDTAMHSWFTVGVRGSFGM